jgi:hypothetical protein
MESTNKRNEIDRKMGNRLTAVTQNKWVSETIEQGNKSQGTGENVTLPPPPSEITVVI